ncbi:MAG: hypothetical protein ACR2F6_15135 [Mycobacteriales bacterium]
MNDLENEVRVALHDYENSAPDRPLLEGIAGRVRLRRRRMTGLATGATAVAVAGVIALGATQPWHSGRGGGTASGGNGPGPARVSPSCPKTTLDHPGSSGDVGDITKIMVPGAPAGYAVCAWKPPPKPTLHGISNDPQKFAALVNPGKPATGGAIGNCGNITTPQYYVIFFYPSGGTVTLLVTTTGCPAITNGKRYAPSTKQVKDLIAHVIRKSQ